MEINNFMYWKDFLGDEGKLFLELNPEVEEKINSLILNYASEYDRIRTNVDKLLKECIDSANYGNDYVAYTSTTYTEEINDVIEELLATKDKWLKTPRYKDRIQRLKSDLRRTESQFNNIDNDNYF